MQRVARLCKISGFCSLAITLAVSPQVDAHELEGGPGFDPTPVVIPLVPRTAPRAITSMDLLTLRDLHGIRISPNGKRVAFVLGQAVYETNSYRSGLFVVGTRKGSESISLGTAGPPRWDEVGQWQAEAPQWSPDSDAIYYRLKRDGVWQVWKWKVEGGEPVQVTRAKHGVQRFHLSADGTELAMMLGAPSATDSDRIAEHGILFDGELRVGDPIPIVDQIAARHDSGAESAEMWVHELRSGLERKATERELQAYGSTLWAGDLTKTFSAGEIQEQHILSAKVSPDTTKLAYQRWLADPAQSFTWSHPLFLKPTIGAGTPIVLTPGIYQVVQYWWAPDSREIYYAEYDGDGRFGTLMRVSVDGRMRQRVLNAPGEALFQYSADRSGRLLACSRESNTTPAEVAIVDLRTGSISTLVDVNPEFQNITLRPAERIDAPAEHGDQLWGHLVLPASPKSGKPNPLVITTYADSDTFLRGAVGDEYPIQVFAANGFAVLDFNRGKFRTKSDDFENTVQTMQWPIDGMTGAIKKLIDTGMVDAAKVGITGASMGAALVAHAISHADSFRAAIQSGGGAFDPDLYFTLPDHIRTGYVTRYGLGAPAEAQWAPKWQRISTSLNAQRIHAPLLINAADSEYVLDMQLVTTLRDVQKPVELFIYADELHLKIQPKHRYEIYERNLDWFKFWFQGLEDPSPEKAEQYRRWEGLCDMQTATDPSHPAFCVGTKHQSH